jgi:addiction module HigA family antidote
MFDTATTTVQSADIHTIKRWVDANEILLVDVRETAEFDKEHIAGALLLPMSSFDAEIFPVLPGKKVVLYCAIGKRSEAAGKMLLNEGHPGAIHMTGGLSAWKAAGLPIEEQFLPTGGQTPAPVFLCPTPGAVLMQEYLQPLKITLPVLAQRTGLPPDMLKALIKGDQAMTVETSLRLARYFSTAPDFWMHLQLDHDMERARHRLGQEIRQQVTPRCAG